MLYAKISTDKTVTFGPVLAADGTMSNGALAYTDAKIFKNGTDGALNASSTFTHKYEGVYALLLKAADLDAVGVYEVVLNKNPLSAAPVKITVLAANVYDWLFGTVALNQLTAAQIATGVWQDATAGDFTTASSIGKALYISNVVPGASGGHMISGTNAGTTVLGALTVTGATTLTGAIAATNASNDLRGISVNMIKDQSVTCSAGVTFNANVGTTQPVNFTGTSTSALVKSDMIDIASAAVSTSTAQIGVNVIQAAGTAWGSGAITAAAIAPDAIGASELAADAITEIQNGLATAAELAKVPKADGNASWNATALAAINAEVDTALNTAIPGSPTADSINERIVAIDAYGAPPTAAAITDAVWDEALSGHTGAGTSGNALSTASSGGVDPSVLADAIWDEALSGHSTAGTAGKKLTDASTLAAGAKMDIVDVPNATAVTAIQNGLSKPGTGQTITANQAVNVAQVGGQTATAAAPVAFNAIVGNATHAIVVDANGYITFNNTLAAAPTVDAIANAVWDETLGDHVGTGSTGKKLTDSNTTTPPTAAAITTTILTDLTSSTDFNTASSFGKLIKDNLDAKVSEVGGGTPPTALAIADAVWDEVLTPHVTAASAAVALAAAGGAADPLLNPVPGTYAAGTAGEALGNIPSVKAKTDLITDGGSVSVLPASVYNDDATILIGQDHLISNGLDLGITGPSWWPVLTGGSVVYELRAGNTVYKQFTGTIVAAKQVTCELTKAVTALINPGNYAFRVLGTEATSNGGETTVLVEGRAIVQY